MDISRVGVGTFVTSSHSGDNEKCVEVAPLSGGGVAVRDSKNVDGHVLRVTQAGWAAFTTGIQGGQF